MALAASVLVLAVLLAGSYHYLHRLIGDVRTDVRRWFVSWVCKGLALPVLFWIVWNLGILPGLPAIMPQIARAQAAGGNSTLAFFDVLISALFVIGSYWTAVTFAWLLTLTASRPAIRDDFFGACLLWSVIMLPLALFILYVGGWPMVGFAGLGWLLPIANSSLPLLTRKKASPQYSRALARIKMGQYEEAEWEVIRELEKSEDDFEGWMMLAELYANHFDDLAGAERTIRDLCGQPNITPVQLSIALHRLADWHLKVGEDPLAARRVLGEICQTVPGTHLAKMAALRINQLPSSRQELKDQRKGRRIHLPALTDDYFAESEPARDTEIDQQEALVQADQFVEKLKKDPDDIPAREELARILAGRLGRPELGIEQIDLLLEMPDQPAQKCAEWLSLIAAWQLKYLHDPQAARQVLQRLIRQFPQSVQGFTAQRHLKLMEVEESMRARRSAARVEA